MTMYIAFQKLLTNIGDNGNEVYINDDSDDLFVHPDYDREKINQIFDTKAR